MIQTALTTLLLLAIGYLQGAIPSGYLAGRWLKGIDLRNCGSGSTGATNVLRNVGKGPALVERADRLEERGEVPLILIDAAERSVDIPVLQFPLWLAFAAGPGERLDDDDLL